MWDTPPAPRLSCHSLLNHGRVKTSLSVVACCCRLLGFVYIWWMDLDFFLGHILWVFSFFSLRLYQELYGFAQGWEIGRVVPFYHWSIETPTPLVLGVGVMFAPVTCFVTFVLATQWECFVRRVLALRKTSSRPSGSVPSAPPTSPRAETSSGVSLPGTSSSSSSLPLGGQGKREGSQCAPGVWSGGASSPSARSRWSGRGGGASGL